MPRAGAIFHEPIDPAHRKVASRNVPGTAQAYRVPVGGTQPPRGTGPVRTVRRLSVAPPSPAVLLGALGLALTAAWVPLTYLTHDLQASRDGFAPVLALACGSLGMLVARRQPRNPEGWLLLSLAVGIVLVVDSGLYAVLDYRVHHGQLPLGEIAVFLRGALATPLILVFPLVILLFPDGRLTRRWKWTLWPYLVLLVAVAAGSAANEAGTIAGQHIQVNLTGVYSGPGSPTGALGTFLAGAGAGLLLVPLFWLAFAARQVVSWRHATGDHRQQLKWLTTGAVLAVIGLALIAVGPPKDQVLGRVTRDLAFLGLAGLPVSMGIGILKYRLYEIDRIISRTLAYAIVTGLLVGVYAGLVLLTTQVFRVHTPVAVAASTLAAAALFNPVRRRVQRAVDRRFNRARYDADQTVAAFAGRLKDAVDLDSVRGDLAGVVHQALEPAHVSVWISQRD
jgi:hypothetical protein